MTKIFIGGSRHVSRLNSKIRERLDTILAKGFPIVIGDANGADKAVQKYLFEKRYSNVEVFCSDGVCRNNVGGWSVRGVPVCAQQRSVDFYSEKDRAMAEEATIGLMVWDGQSVGTLLNVFRLVERNKRAVVYAVPEGKFIEFRGATEWDAFMRRCDTVLRRKVEQRAKLETPRTATRPAQPSLFDHGHRP